MTWTGNGHVTPALSVARMSLNLYGAINDKFTASPELAATVPGGLLTSYQTDIATEPYAVLVPISSVPNWTSGTPYIQSSAFQFSVFGKDGASVLAGMLAIENVFDWAKLPLTNGEDAFAFKRTNEIGPFAEENAPVPATWHGIVEYEIWVTRYLGL